MYKKILAVQSEVGAISKDSTNPFFKSKYFDINKLLDVVMPVLNKHGLVLLQPLTHIDGKSAIKTILIDSETGDSIENSIPLTENPDPQKMGSAITYYRRYSLQSLLGLQAEDDDGNIASNKYEKKKLTEIEQLEENITKAFKELKYTKDQIKATREEYLEGKAPDVLTLGTLLKDLRNEWRNKNE